MEIPPMEIYVMETTKLGVFPNCSYVMSENDGRALQQNTNAKNHSNRGFVPDPLFPKIKIMGPFTMDS